ncbi:glycoside hydrolase family 2 protein, partial [Gemmatimonadota bacterium]
DYRGPVPEALFFFAPPKELALGTPVIRITAEGPGNQVEERGPWVNLSLDADILARDVYLSLGATAYHFEENFFHLLPGRSRSIRLFTDLSPEEVESRLRIRTLAEIPQDGVPASSSTVGPDSVVTVPDSATLGAGRQ